MEAIINNWVAIFSILAVVVVAICGVYTFTQLNREAQIEKVREWLKYAVAMAEKELGSGTGQLKLRRVYDLFVQRFGWVAKLITFTEFSQMVDDALVWLNLQLDSNTNLKVLINEI